MFKVFYAASPFEGAAIRLERFMENIKPLPIEVKVAAYTISSPKDINIDYTLDNLLNISYPDNKLYMNNENLSLYYDYIKKFNPDLIINDFDVFTSYVSDFIDVPIWQCSPLLLISGLSNEQKAQMSIFKRHRYLIHKYFGSEYVKHSLHNSNRKLIYSHFGDSDIPLQLNEGFQWIRPYHKIGKQLQCDHKITSVSLSNQYMIHFYRKYDKCIAFSNIADNYFSSKVKNFSEDYYDYLRNSDITINEGYTNFLADAYYNNKFCVIAVNLFDMECVANALITEYLANGKIIYETFKDDINIYANKQIITCVNKNVKYLHEEILEIM